MLKITNMQSAMVSNRYILGIVAFSVSFGISLVPSWDINQALITGIITVLATYAAALFIDKRRRNYEMLVLTSLHQRIKETEGLKSRIFREINEIEEHRNLLYAESQKLENQILDCRNQRDSLHRDLGVFAGQKKQLESETNLLSTELETLEKNKIELNKTCSHLTAEKRRLELNCHVHQSEIAQIQNQICQLQQEKQEFESNLSLLGRLKPQLEEKMYELRIQIQEIEIEVNQQNQLLITTRNETEKLSENLHELQNKITEKQSELKQVEGQVSLLQQERDLLQNQVWELLQQTENFNQDISPDNLPENENELFPFSELVEPLESHHAQSHISELLPEEWQNFLEQLPNHEIEVLKAIVEQENPKPTIKQIAETNITMPNLLIDSINQHANDTIGELIIEPSLEIPEVYQEHMINVRKILAVYAELIAKHPSSN